MRLTNEQRDLLRSLNLPDDFSNLTLEQSFNIDDVMNHEMQYSGINDTSDGLNDYGSLCESIIVSLPDNLSDKN